VWWRTKLKGFWDRVIVVALIDGDDSNGWELPPLAARQSRLREREPFVDVVARGLHGESRT
jgi:hypothetical protein